VGIARAGAVQVSVNPLYTARELEHQLNDAGCQTIIIYTGSTPVLAEIIGKTAIQTVITVSPADTLAAALPSPPVDARLAACVPFEQALEVRKTLARVPVALSGADPLFLQYTGGTTGLSKGATLSHRNLVANTEQFKALMPAAIRPGEEVIVTAIPLHHIFALMVNFITYCFVGAENWLVANPRDMDCFVGVLKAARPTVFMGVNTLYAGLTMHPGLKEVDWSRLRLAGGGGSAVVGVVSERWKAITGTFIREGYGLSETSPVLSFNPAYINEFSGTTGLPLPSTDIVLLDTSGNEVAVDEAGEVCAKGPQVMSGYWQQPEANAAAFTADGYFKTGDVGQFDERGFLKIVDRKKDMVIVSGFNVYPNDVEAVASACPVVAECACVGVPDEKTGEAVKLFVVKMPGASVTEAEMVAHCRTGMTGYKVPKIRALRRRTAQERGRQDPAAGTARCHLNHSSSARLTPAPSRWAGWWDRRRRRTSSCAMPTWGATRLRRHAVRLPTSAAWSSPATWFAAPCRWRPWPVPSAATLMRWPSPRLPLARNSVERNRCRPVTAPWGPFPHLLRDELGQWRDLTFGALGLQRLHVFISPAHPDHRPRVATRCKLRVHQKATDPTVAVVARMDEDEEMVAKRSANAGFGFRFDHVRQRFQRIRNRFTG
jgi:long-chain acyl-CoA synthetase